MSSQITGAQGVIGPKGPEGPNGCGYMGSYKDRLLKLYEIKVKEYNKPNGSVAADYMRFNVVSKDSLKKSTFLEDVPEDKKDMLLSNINLIYDYMKNEQVLFTVSNINTASNINIAKIIFEALKKIAIETNEKLTEPDKFYKYCVEFIKSSYSHYQNVQKVNNGKVLIGIENSIRNDLCNNLISILKQNEEE